MRLTGIPVPDQLALQLSPLLRDAGFDPTAEVLEDSYDQGRVVVALTIPDREAILRVLDDPPDGLAELRGVLMREHGWRQDQGLG